MFDQSTVLPSRRVCVLLGGPGSPASFVEPRLAALLRPASRPLQGKPPAFGVGVDQAADFVEFAGQPA